MLYLDNAATSYKKPKEFYKSMNRYTKELSVNAGRGGHFYSLLGARKILDTAEALAELIGTQNPERIAFSQNATMSLNQAIGGVLKNGGHAIVTEMDHNSVLRPVSGYGNFTMVKADPLGRIDPKDIEKAIRPTTKLIAITHASNVCGTVMPIAKIGEIARKNRVLFLVDGAQTVGAKAIDVEKMNIDMLAFSAHKGLLGPLGLGGLYVREGISLSPIISGGTGTMSQSLTQPDVMPDLLQAGTQNVPAIAALRKSIEYINKRTVAEISELQTELSYILIEGLLNMNKVRVYGITDKLFGDRNGTVLFNIGDEDSGYIAERLNNEFKIAVRGGWHCAYYAHLALGSEKRGGVRASFGAFSKRKDAIRLIDAVYKIQKGI